MTEQQAVQLLEDAHKYLREQCYANGRPVLDVWQAYHAALCILENAIYLLSPVIGSTYID